MNNEKLLISDNKSNNSEFKSNKPIEEMAKIIARRSTAFRNPNVAFMTTATKTAESLYNAGYRKQSELSPCDVCRFNIESGGDGLRCMRCPALRKGGGE